MIYSVWIESNSEWIIHNFDSDCDNYWESCLLWSQSRRIYVHCGPVVGCAFDWVRSWNIFPNSRLELALVQFWFGKLQKLSTWWMFLLLVCGPFDFFLFFLYLLIFYYYLLYLGLFAFYMIQQYWNKDSFFLSLLHIFDIVLLSHNILFLFKNAVYGASVGITLGQILIERFRQMNSRLGNLRNLNTKKRIFFNILLQNLAEFRANHTRIVFFIIIFNARLM